VLGAAERRTRAEAIRLYTSGAAYAMRREASWGSLEAGKWADFVVLDRDILGCHEDEMKGIRPVRTFLGGVEVYSA
jgi:predicted amidohydrolase YtcJ